MVKKDDGCGCSASCCNRAAAPLPPEPPPASGCRYALYRIDDMDCPTEEALIRDRLGRIDGVTGLEFDLMRRLLTVNHRLDSLDTVEAALRDIDMGGVRIDASPSDLHGDPTAAVVPPRHDWRPLAFSGAAATLAEAAEWGLGAAHWAVPALALAAILTGGLPTYRKGWIALRNLNLNMNALMSIAVTGAALIGRWPEAAMVMFLFALAEVIEARSLDRARDAIRGLMELAPETATVRRADGDWEDRPARDVPVGAVARLKPGERIALDGVVTAGRSTVNQAPITGESLPVEKAEGDPLFAGTINEAGSLEFRVTETAGHSTLARIIHAVESAQGSRAPTQRFVDRFASVYTPVVFAAALGVATVPPLLFSGAWPVWIYRALVLLVIACPCALVISTPVSIVSGLAAAARKGILVKGGAYLEEGRNLKTLALDKTGTLTYGRPEQTDFIALRGDPAAARILAASLAARSDHPVSRAVARAAADEGLTTREVDDFTALPGRGVRGNIDGQPYRLGNHRLIEELGLCSESIDAALGALELQGKTAVLLVDRSEALAIFAVADTVRETSRQAVAELHSLGVKTLMLTGDNARTAETIARAVGIDEARGHLLPADKLGIVEGLLAGAGGGKVGMVGDGINDAPALARADIGFAMGAAGSDTAIETADVALMDDDLRKIPAFIRLSRATARTLAQNVALALGIKAVFLALTVAGRATMWMAVFADMGASLIVVFNGLRLLRR